MVKKKKPGEIRLRKELGELDMPKHAKVKFPDEEDIMNFEVVILPLFYPIRDQQ